MGVYHAERGYGYQKIITAKLMLDMFCGIEKEFVKIKYQAREGEHTYVDDIIVGFSNGSIHYCQCKQSSLDSSERKKIISEIIKQSIHDKTKGIENNKYIIYTESKDDVLRDISEISVDLIKKQLDGNIDIEKSFGGKRNAFEALYEHIKITKIQMPTYRSELPLSIEDCKNSMEIEENIDITTFITVLAKIELISVDITILDRQKNIYCQFGNIKNFQGLYSEIIGKLFPGTNNRYGIDVTPDHKSQLSNFKENT